MSAIHLAEGTLKIERVVTARIRARLVVLSACDSGLSHASTNDDAAGLVGALLAAGAKTVIAAMWPVDADVATEFCIERVGLEPRVTWPASSRRQPPQLRRTPSREQRQ